MGLHWMLWAFVDLCWPSLAIVGCCGPSWACMVGNKIRNKWYIIKKNIPMAQTTHLALFGPFLVFVGLCWPSLAIVGCCGPSWACVVGNKIRNKLYIFFLKTYLWPKQHVWRRLGPFYSLWACVGLRWPS